METSWVQGVTLLVLTAAALFAGWQVLEARRDRRQRHRPFVVADFEGTAVPFAEVVLTNVGTVPALDLTIRFNEEPQSALVDGGRWSALDAKLFKDGLPTMPPGRRVRALFDRIPDRIQAKLPMSYTVTLSYRDDRDRWYQDDYVLDLDAISTYRFIDLKGVHEGVKELEKIRKLLEKLAP